MIKLKGAHFLTVFLMCLVFWFIPVILFAQEIKPGIVITEKNYERYLPALKEVMDPGSYLVVVPYLRKGLITMPINRNRRVSPVLALSQIHYEV